jgi:beta-xylosidase
MAARAFIPGALAAIAILSSASSANAQCFPNPIRDAATADPGVLRVGSAWYVYHTGKNSSGAYPILKSTDRVNWTNVGYIFTPGRYPGWCNESPDWWAPEVHFVNGRYVAYFSARQDSNGKFAIGAATSSSPEGPFTSIGPPIATHSGWGLIDASFFKDPETGRSYCLWKDDKNALSPQQPTPIVLYEVQADGVTRIGPAQLLIQNTLAWEGNLVEAPSLVYRNNYYYLFYSANAYYDDRYAVGVARATSVGGPYTKLGDPILVSDAQYSGPGHQFIMQDSSGEWLMFYHARVKANGTTARHLMQDAIAWGADNWPSVHDGTPSAGMDCNRTIVDNSNGGFSASSNWSTGTSAADKYGSNYRFHATEAVSDAANFTANLGAGSYNIFAWWSQGANRSATAPYVLPDGTVISKNQQTNGGKWNLLGSRTLNGSVTTKLSCWTTTGFVVIADAIKYER